MKKHLLPLLSLTLLSAILFFTGIENLSKHSYDEFHYIPAAKNFLNAAVNTNWEHPPLAKWIIALGIKLFGDNPFGWRVMSAAFGILTLLGMYAWGVAAFGRRSIGVWVALLSLANHFLYVQARIAMLDSFMIAGIVWGMAFLFRLFRSPIHAHPLALHVGAGVSLGFAMACKWFGVIPLFFGAAMVAGGILFKKIPARTAWHTWAACWIALPMAVYYLSFAPDFNFKTFLEKQTTMYDGQLRVVDSHAYMSDWKGWPIMQRPIWYSFDRETDGIRNVALIGNPLILWGGMLALWIVLVRSLRARNTLGLLSVLTYAALYVSWGIIPRKLFFFYYYYPAVQALSIVWAFVFFSSPQPALNRPSILFLIASLLVFVGFYPILSGILLPPEAFRSWMWFRSWI